MNSISLDDFKNEFDKHIICFFEEIQIEENIKEALSYSVKNGGKRLRPWFIYNFGKSEDISSENLINAGIAVEILHSSSLIHDDLPALDDANFRRGVLTNHLRFGEYKAILAGDYGFTLPLKIIMDLKDIELENKLVALRYFIEDTLKMFEGEMRDLIYEKDNLEVETSEIINMYANKSGAIFGLSFSLPFFLAGEYKLGEKMHEIGIDFGISFQIFDDLKDLLKSEKELGKDTHKDVNKKTLLNKMSSKEVKIVADNYYSRVIENLLTLNYSDMVRNLIEIRNIVESR